MFRHIASDFFDLYDLGRRSSRTAFILSTLSLLLETSFVVPQGELVPLTLLLSLLFQIIILSKFLFRFKQLLLENPVVCDLNIPYGSIFANYRVVVFFVVPYPTYPTYREKQPPIFLDSVVYTYYYLLMPSKTIVQPKLKSD